MSNKPTKNNAKQKQSFFAYYRAEAQRLRSERLVRVCGGFIIDDATDVGPGSSSTCRDMHDGTGRSI
jgi:hypothetical protein